MQRDRAMTIYFMDGTHVSFDFPEQKTNDAARSILFEEGLKSPYIMVEADGAVLLYYRWPTSSPSSSCCRRGRGRSRCPRG